MEEELATMFLLATRIVNQSAVKDTLLEEEPSRLKKVIEYLKSFFK